ncbi:hypothetical protein Q4514_18575, partial [Celeribacter halophilus]|uniref:hypothetical protein n=1 Tax=Celeribacter halophilus TaxID=576117 RepID=UPI0026E28249
PKILGFFFIIFYFAPKICFFFITPKKCGNNFFGLGFFVLGGFGFVLFLIRRCSLIFGFVFFL